MPENIFKELPYSGLEEFEDFILPQARGGNLTSVPVEIPVGDIFTLTLPVKRNTLYSIPFRSNPFAREPWLLSGPWALVHVCSLSFKRLGNVPLDVSLIWTG
jgi:hypothetical protein